MDDVALATRNLSRVVDGTALVEDITMEVAAGDVFVVFGPSGSGKSTLLRLLNRLDEPTDGTVLLGGTDYRTMDPQTVRQRVGLVPQRPTLIEGTVADNVTWGPRLREAPVDRTRMADLLDRLGLGGCEERQANDLSGGEAQRVAVARTLFNEPEVVLLDEPMSSLDAAAADRVEDLLADVMDAYDLTAVLVTHDADRARRLGTGGVRLEAGQVVRSGAIGAVVI
ncbi:MAG: choline transporter [Bacteroidetes bacterium SW_9_63_38]|nr:MAG: choline transporter [Bacteroidetes bacterium SW_9_63_38]